MMKFLLGLFVLILIVVLPLLLLYLPFAMTKGEWYRIDLINSIAGLCRRRKKRLKVWLGDGLEYYVLTETFVYKDEFHCYMKLPNGKRKKFYKDYYRRVDTHELKRQAQRGMNAEMERQQSQHCKNNELDAFF
jgi:hypothetical protein